VAREIPHQRCRAETGDRAIPAFTLAEARAARDAARKQVAHAIDPNYAKRQDSGATNLVDQKSFYVGISRAKESATIFTNDRGKLVSAINERAGQVQTALPQAAMPTPVADKAAGAGIG